MRRLLVCLLLPACICVAVPPPAASAATINVDITTDTVDPNDGHCSLRDRTGVGGSNSSVFNGRIRKKALKAGPYRLAALATDEAGNKSRTTHASFRVVK
jgi:CSLREA domain-containing protein